VSHFLHQGNACSSEVPIELPTMIHTLALSMKIKMHVLMECMLAVNSSGYLSPG